MRHAARAQELNAELLLDTPRAVDARDDRGRLSSQPRR